MPLESAVGADPGNASAWLELAEWYGEQCRVSLVAEPFRREALLCAERAQLLDPDNKEAYLFQHRLYAFMAQRSSAHDKEQYGLAAAAMGAAVECDPTEARLHYELAESLFLADLPVDGRSQARIAQELDEQSTQPERQLSDAQRAQIRTWLTKAE
jgi:Tfp pilus assembly protein PilF